MKKILLINVDSKFNLAIRRMYNYFSLNNYVVMKDLKLNGYPGKKKIIVDASGFDKVYASNIFEINQNRFEIINCNDIEYGGIGSINPGLKLPEEIENTEPFYFENEDTSYGFITRGCIRNCFFCKVPKYEGKLKVYNSLENIIKHHKVKFLDNNILAYDKHMEVFQHLIDHNVRCEFNQGLDFRLINEDNANLLSKLNYMGDYIFAFDDPKYQSLLEKKLKIIKKYISKDWKVKFYIYQNKDMDISLLIDRVEWCRKNKCLPYVMRDLNCWDCKEKNFYIDYAAYCNQPMLFKNFNFESFLNIRYKNKKRIQESLNIFINNSNKN